MLGLGSIRLNDHSFQGVEKIAKIKLKTREIKLNKNTTKEDERDSGVREDNGDNECH